MTTEKAEKADVYFPIILSNNSSFLTVLLSKRAEIENERLQLSMYT